MKQGIFLRDLTAEAEEAVIDIIGVIGWEVWYPALRDMLRGIPDTVERVVFEIYSPGGDVWEGNAIIQEIGAMKQETVARVQVAASMATLIAVATDKREIAANGRWLIHNPWSALMGDADDLEKRAKELRDAQNEAAAFYAKRTGQSAEAMLALMDEERWLTAQEAKELGFVDTINDPFAVADYREVAAEMVAAHQWPTAIAALAEVPVETEGEDASTEPNQPAADEPDAPTADAAGTADGDGIEDGEPDPAVEQAREFAALVAKVENSTEIIAALEGKLTRRDELISRLQSEKAGLERKVAAINESLSAATKRLDRMLAGGMAWKPAVETWEDAVKAAGSYEQARKDYPDVYRARREQDRRARK